MGSTFFIADTHFGHDAIRVKLHRPFASAAEMDEHIIARWNSAVAPGDEVWVLGDYSLRCEEDTAAITSRLNGVKYLVRGNNDLNCDEFYLRCGFRGVYDLPVVWKEKYILSHEPMVERCAGTGFINLFGHVHNLPPYLDYTADSFCLSCERVDYTPVRFERIREIILSL